MKRIALVTVALIVGAIACEEVATSPQPAAPESTAGLIPRYRLGNPPPPPIDTGASFVPSATAYRAPRYSPYSPMRLVGLYQGCPSDPTQIFLPTVPATYMYDPNGNTGWLHFSDAPFSNIDTDANGMVKMSNIGGVQDFSGKGKIKFDLGDGCVVIIDLTRVSDAESHFGECGVNTDLAQEPPPGRDQGCFSVEFEDIIVNGVTTTVDVRINPAPPPCEPGDTRPICTDVDIIS